MRLSEKNEKTLNKYYERVNLGDFMGVSECLSEDVVFSIPGNSDLLPFSGKWKGHEKVLKLFERFGNAFWIVGMSETRTITTETDVYSFNDEAFKVKKNGKYYRVGVMHHIIFDENGLIKYLGNIHDTYVAELAFADKAAIAEPILAEDILDGEEEVDDKKAEVIIKDMIDKIKSKKPLNDMFSDSITIISTGDCSKIDFAGIWVGKDQALEYFKNKEKSIISSNFEIVKLVINNGSAVVEIKEDGKVNSTGKDVSLYWSALIQIDENLKIGKITVYLDTAELMTKI